MPAREPKVRLDWNEARRTAAVEVIARIASAEAGVRMAVVFGSFARGEPFADIDVAVAMDEPWGYLGLGRLAGKFESAIGAPGVEVDLVPIEAAHPWLRYRIAREGRVAWSRDRWDWPAFFSHAIVEGRDLLLALRRAGHPLGRQAP